MPFGQAEVSWGSRIDMGAVRWLSLVLSRAHAVLVGLLFPPFHLAAADAGTDPSSSPVVEDSREQKRLLLQTTACFYSFRAPLEADSPVTYMS